MNGYALLAWVLVPAACLLVTPAGTDSRSAAAIVESSPLLATLGGGGPDEALGLPLTQEPPLADAYCLTCHGDSSLTAGFSNGRTLSLYANLLALRDSAHDLLSCVTCHDTYEPPPPERTEPYDFAAYQAQATEMCVRCHTAAAEGYAASAHSETVIEEGEGATCIDCHSPDGSGHSVAATKDPGSILSPARIAESCGRCHEEALSTYHDTSHGKVERFGDVKSTATCTTCHSDHAVQPADDLVAAPGESGLLTVCRDCHDGADGSFARAWPGHSEGARGGSPADVAGRAGFFLAAAVVGFGLVHASLDLFRRWAGARRRLM